MEILKAAASQTLKQVGEQGWGHLCGVEMKGVGQLTEEISVVGYEQAEDKRTYSPKLTWKSWSQRRKENTVSMVPLRQKKRRRSRESQREGREGLRHRLALGTVF